MSKDLYSILGLSRGADSGEIRRQYLKLSRQFHPDKVSSDQKESAEARFKGISEAYEILSDDQKRSFYDQTGQVPGENPQNNGMPGGMPFPFNMNEMFGMFGRGGMGGGYQQQRGRRPGKASTRKTQIPLTLKDLYYGRTLQINLERQRFCPDCKGEGATNTRSCNDCNGQGMKRQVVQMGPIVMENMAPCNSCAGRGKTRGDSCRGCSGSKFIRQDKSLQLNIQKGMKAGDVITFPGESSHIDEFEEAGDVIVEIQAADEDNSWVREGPILKSKRIITLGQSLCGTKVSFMDHPGYPDGILLDIPIGIQNTETLVFNGLGMPIDNERFGELHLTIIVKATKSELEVLKNNLQYFQGLFTNPDGPSGDKLTKFSAHRMH